MNLRGGWIFLSLGLLRQLLVCLFWLLSLSCLPGPVVSLFCLQAEQGLSLPVSALSLLSQQVISLPLCSNFSSSHLAFKNTSRVVQECSICPLGLEEELFNCPVPCPAPGFPRPLRVKSWFSGPLQTRSHWLRESCYFVLRTGMSLLLLGSPEANHSEGVWSCPGSERTLQRLRLLAASLPTQAYLRPGLLSIPGLTLPGAWAKPSRHRLTEVERQGDLQNFERNLTDSHKSQ